MLKRAGQVIFRKKFEISYNLKFEYERLPRYLSHEKRSVYCSRISGQFSRFSRLLAVKNDYHAEGGKRQNFQVAGRNEEQQDDDDLDQEKDSHDKLYEYDYLQGLSELEWLFRTMEKLPEYSNTVIARPKIQCVSSENAEKLLGADWGRMSPQEITKNFATISFYLYEKKDDLTNVNYKKVLDSLEASIDALDNSQTESVMTHLQLWGSRRNVDVLTSILEKLDANLLERYRNNPMNHREKLRFCHAIACLGRAKKSTAYWLLVNKLKCKLHQLSLAELIHFISLINANWKIFVNMHEVEYNINKYLKDLNIQELSIIGLAFYKKSAQTKNPEFLNTICQKGMENADSLGSFELASIMKFIRSFRYHKSHVQFTNFLKNCSNILSSANMTCCTHTLHAMASMRVLEKNTFNIIIKRFENELGTVRLKDVERLLLSLSVFNYTGKHLIDKILEELRNPSRALEMAKHKSSLGYSLMFLAQLNIYPKDLLEKVMDPAYMRNVYPNNYVMEMEYFFLDLSIQIEVPDYTGPRLDEKCLHQQINHFKKRISIENNESGVKKSLSYRDETSMEIILEYRKIFGESAIHIDHVLPHFLDADVILALDENDQSLPAKDILGPLTGIKYIPKNYRNGKKWFVLIVGNRYTCIGDSCMAVGFCTAKMRQFRKIGYIPILIPIDLWANLPCSKSQYLKDLLLNNPSIESSTNN